jgi:hypothetical protein
MFRLFGREQPIHKVLGGGKRMAPSLIWLMLSLFIAVLLLNA